MGQPRNEEACRLPHAAVWMYVVPSGRALLR